MSEFDYIPKEIRYAEFSSHEYWPDEDADSPDYRFECEALLIRTHVGGHARRQAYGYLAGCGRPVFGEVMPPNFPHIGLNGWTVSRSAREDWHTLDESAKASIHDFAFKLNLHAFARQEASQ